MPESKGLRRIRITHVHPRDAHYPSKDRYIGVTGTFDLESSGHTGYYSGFFHPDNTSRVVYFIGVRYRRI